MKRILLTFFSMVALAGSIKVHAQNYSLNQQGLSFRENKGQVHDQYNNPRPDIDAQISDGAFQVFVGKKGLHYQWMQPTSTTVNRLKHERTARKNRESINPAPYTAIIARIDVELIGANPNAQLRKENKKALYNTFYNIKSAPDGITAYHYEKLVYENIYPNIDWVIYTQNGKMKYDFVVRPGGKVSDIRMQYKGATKIKLEEGGDLVLASELGETSELAPYSYQAADGQTVSSSYQLQGDILSFSVANYSGTLVIDPAVDWATYFGEAGSLWIMGEGLKVDHEGKNVYINGNAAMTQNLATAGAYMVTANNLQSGYLAKFSEKGTLQWCTYYGGDANVSSGLTSGSVIIDTAGNITVTGSTGEPTFGIATPGAYQTTFGGGGGDMFMMQFTPEGQRRWGTFFGGEGEEWAFQIIPYGGHIYIGGITDSRTQIATPGSFISASGGSFLAKLNLAGTQKEWGTYCDSQATSTLGFALDPSGNMYLVGGTYSTAGYATPGAFQPQHNVAAGTEYITGTITKFANNGQRSWASYWGGEYNMDGFANGAGIVIDENYNVFAAMGTKSKQFMATPGSYQDTLYGELDVCLARFDSSGKRIWATYVGGEGNDYISNMTLDEQNNIWLSGNTSSTENISTPDALKTQYGGSLMDAFIIKFDTSGIKKWGSYYGGEGMDDITKTNFHKGYLYFAGASNSMDSGAIATPNAHQVDYPGALVGCAMVGRICFNYTPQSGIAGATEVCGNGTFKYTAEAVENADEYLWILPNGWEGTSNTNEIEIKFANSESGNIQLRVVRCEDTSAVVSLPITIVPGEKPIIQVNGNTLSTAGSYVYHQWLLNGEEITGATEATYKVTENGHYSVIVSQDQNCVDTSDEYIVNNATSIGNLDNQQLIRLYPNPVQNTLHIDAAQSINIAIYTIEGKLVKSVRNAQTVMMDELVNGQYLVYCTDANDQFLQVSKIQVLVP